MSERLKALFADLPKLNAGVVGQSRFCLPALELSKSTLAVRKRLETTSTSRPESATLGGQDTEQKAISRLLGAISDATSKLEFAKTSTEEWQRSLVFAGTKAVRRSSKRQFEFVHSKESQWTEGMPINLSKDSSDDWFKRILLHRLREGAIYRHSQIVLGDKGCGKSTLLKYLITKNSQRIQAEKVVFSRFEFMKFYKQWKDRGNTKNEALLNYLSFIHARDLFLDHFFILRDCNTYELKLQFQSEKGREAGIQMLAVAMRRLAPVVGVRDDDAFDEVVSGALHNAKLGNAELMSFLKQQSSRLRVLLVGSLWEDKTVVTVFDGLDSLDVHDAFQKTDRWALVKYLVENRAQLSSPTVLREAGEVNESDSILVLRRNTAAQLEYEYEANGKPLEFEAAYAVAPIDGLAATLSVMRRSALKMFGSAADQEKIVQEVTFELMRIAQRTMIALSRNGVARVRTGLLYNLFGGDLREQFRFLSAIFDWSVKEMLSFGYLDSDDYFESSPRKLIGILASSRGTDFLIRKSYRIVELLIHPDGGAFENAAKVVRSSSVMMGEAKSAVSPVSNKSFSGHLDNILNYLDESEAGTIDEHAFLKKVRAVQLLSKSSLSDHEFVIKMESLFGYGSVGMKELIIFLLQTEFIAAEVTYRSGVHSVSLSATAKGKFCVESLIFNLAYLENVFHSTLFPMVLVAHISDKERSVSVTEWAASSIRNAYIFLAYFALIEKNAAAGKVVPSEYQLLSRMQERVGQTIQRMIEPRGAVDRSDDESDKISLRALEQIKKTREQWKDSRAL